MNEDLPNLATHVRARRAHKDWTQLDVYNQGGPSNSTLTAVEDARPPGPSRSTLRKLDVGLQWESGSARRVLEGGEPTPLEATPAGVGSDPVGGDDDDDGSLNYRRPEGLTDEQWRQLRARTRNMIEWEIEQALRQNRG